jgi:hypothetical protein
VGRLVMTLAVVPDAARAVQRCAAGPGPGRDGVREAIPCLRRITPCCSAHGMTAAAR